MSSNVDAFYYGEFPAGFAWSTATASYQIEGAWNEDGKGLNNWDTFTHQPDNVLNGDTGDVACDSYHKYEEDVALMKNIGTTHYRFSLSWARLMPDGTKNTFNQAGVDFYNRVINALLSAGIQPFITLYHWDLPKTLQDIGGWTNPILAEHFRDYARLCFSSFGDRVKLWLTFNEPFVFTWEGYGSGVMAPGIKDPGFSPYRATHTVLKAHAKAYHLYDTEFRPQQKGQIGITLNSDFKFPKDSNNPADVEAAERAMQFQLGWFANPIFGSGDYPEVMKMKIAKKSIEHGLSQSRLPAFSAEDVQYIKGTFDFFGLNHYTSRLVSPSEKSTRHPNYQLDQDVCEEVDPSWERGASEWLYVVPHGLRKLLNWIKDTYNNVPVYVTENGLSDSTGTVDDQHRVNYYNSYINEVLKAIRLDGCDVRGYTAWSLLDNFEWARGYSERFGMHYVDYTDPNRPRTPKASARFYSQIIKNNGFKHQT